MGIMKSERCRVWRDDSDGKLLAAHAGEHKFCCQNPHKKARRTYRLAGQSTNKLVSSRPARDIVSTNRKRGRWEMELREGIQKETAKI